MYRISTYFFSLIVGLLLIPQLAAQQSPDFSSDISTAQKPWTHLNFENDPDNFQFAIVTDRTGGPRPGVFEDAIKKLNWLRPEFVMSVGDLIQGVSGRDSTELAAQWGRHFERIKPLEMPFFHLAGNHDIKANNSYQVDYWNKLFGTPFYSFRYKDVLFLGLFTNEGFQEIGAEQIQYFKKVLTAHEDVRWTLVFMHHPLWIYPHDSKFDQIEDLLKDRKYTVYAGHHHRYHHYERKKSNYYVLATTGGGSGLLGNRFGMFDHITWVTMTDDGPVMANLRLDGILPHDIANDETTALSQELIKSVFFDSNVFVDSQEKFSKGKAYLSYTNDSDLPLFLEGRFFHNHHVLATPSKLSVEIPPHGQQHVEIELEAIEPFNLNEKVLLEMDGTLSYKNSEYPDLKLSGKQPIKLAVSKYNLMVTEEAEFMDEFVVKMAPPLPGTHIHYTLDGSTPTAKSPVYSQPIPLTNKTIVKAALISAEGMSSEVDSLMLYPIQAGSGVLCKYYEYDQRKGNWVKVPDFTQLEPTTIKLVKELDLKKAGKRNDFFGLVYQGMIELPETGTYRFSTVSDDGSVLLIDGKPVVIDAVKHKPREVFGEIELEKGTHTYEVHFYQHKKGMVMDVFVEMPSGVRKKVDSSMLSVGKDMELSSWGNE